MINFYQFNLTNRRDLVQVNLKHHLRNERAGKKRHRLFQPTLFTLIGAIVRKYRLGSEFLGYLTRTQENLPEILQDGDAPKAKAELTVPLFFLATLEEYQVIMTILQDYDNPYLPYAHCPAEILLSKHLYRRRPHLSPEVLSSRHFAVLFQEDDIVHTKK